MNRPPLAHPWRPLRLEDFTGVPELPPELPLVQERARRWLPPEPSSALKTITAHLQDNLAQPVSVHPQPLKITDSETNSTIPANGWCAIVLGPSSLKSLLTLDLRLSLALIDAMLKRPPSATRRLRPLSPMERGLLDALVDQTLQHLQGALGTPLMSQVCADDALLRSWSPPQRALTLTLKMHIGESSGLLHWRAAAADWLALPATPVHRPLQLPNGATRWPVTLNLHLGEFTLPTDALRRLEPGGLLLGALTPQPSFHVTLTHSGGACVYAQFDTTSSGQGVLKVISKPDPRQEDAMNSGDVFNPGELPVTVHLEWGRLNLTVARCAGLTVGDVLPLEDALTRPVTLRAGTQTLAQAEIVRVGEALGLRIVSVAKEATPSSADQ